MGEVPGVGFDEAMKDAEIAKKQLEKMIEFVKFREYPKATNGLDILKEASVRIAELTANWIRVGFCQGNFNSDNCLIAGRQMDYGPFGFIEKYDPLWNMWTGGGEHFAFMNQMQAGEKNFETLASSILPVLTQEQQEEAEALVKNQFAVATDALNEVWRRKLGLKEWCIEGKGIILELLGLMHSCESDYTIVFRQLSHVVSSPKDGLKLLQEAHFKPLDDRNKVLWSDWIVKWIKLLSDQSVSLESVGAEMRLVSPKYVPREWMLIDAYEKAYQGDYSIVNELYQLFRRPYDEQPQFEEKYYKRAPDAMVGKAGVHYMT